ncbi:restriction endonuclease [Amycolatopsis sp. NPDC048633]|uniref:nSTAND3 domain-containing NTPase n=1 Tax=Amycolatopsis sp. NPDC048633 TaxID=3157095 RepID=UPI0033FD1591
MDSFDLGRLSDYDFEVLCRDLFEEMLGLRIEIFARGADGGVDLRHMADDGSSVVIQCKHWARTGRTKLLAHMRDKERPKIAALQPARYILATSVELTVDAKDTLLEDLSPFVRTTGDLYGAEQIAEELRKRPGLVRQHFRLWLSNTTVLQEVLRQDALIRSADLVDELDEAAKTFVPTPVFDTARRLLGRESICLLAGIPGVGKTTIAKMLARLHLENGYQVVDVSRDVDEIDRAWLDGTPQLFFYDDFLGQITLEHQLGKNEDRRLLRVMRRVRKTPGKLLLLTTREYILQEAKRRYESLDDGDLEPVTCDVRMGTLNRGVRANILYNHVYYSQLTTAEKRRFADPSRWLELVRHRNFNPRLVEGTLRLAARDDTEDVAKALLLNFENPERIWAHAVEEDLDEPAVHLLEALFTFNGHAELDFLHKAWAHYRTALGQDDSRRLFDRAMKVLDGSMIETWRELALFEVEFPTQLLVDFDNPSIRDYLQVRVLSNRAPLDKLLDSVTDAPRIHRLATLASDHPGSFLLNLMLDRSDSLTTVLVDNAADPESCLEIATVIASHELAEFAVGAIENDVLDSDLYDDSNSLASLASGVEASEFIPEDTRLRLSGELLDKMIRYEWDANDELIERWSAFNYLEDVLTDLEVRGASERLQTLEQEITAAIYEELGEWLNDEVGKAQELARHEPLWELDEILSFIPLEELPEELRPGYSAAMAALETLSREQPKDSRQLPLLGQTAFEDGPAAKPRDLAVTESFRSLLEDAS